MEQKDHDLIAQAQAKKEQNANYFPSLEELRAIDKYLISEAKNRNIARLTLRIPEDLKERFEKKTEELDISMSQVSRKLIEGWLLKTSANKSV